MRGPCAIAAIVVAGTAASCPTAFAGGSTTAYKCTTDGRTLYSDRPCATGQQSTYAIDSTNPLPAERAAAHARLRDDQRALAELQRDRLKREEVVLTPRRLEAERTRKAATCSRLGLRAKRAQEDYDHAGPRDQLQKQTRSRRAEEDRAAACAKR